MWDKFIGSLIDGFISMMELFIGCNSLITLGITMHHMDFATKSIAETDSGQFNDLGLYCFVLMIFALLMKVYMGMVSGYMGSLCSSTFNDWHAAPNYKTITIYTAAIFVVYAGTMVGGAFSVYSLYYPEELKVYSPFSDDTNIRTIGWTRAVFGILTSLMFVTLLFVKNCFLMGTEAFYNTGMEESLKYSYAQAIITGNKYGAINNILPTLGFLGILYANFEVCSYYGLALMPLGFAVILPFFLYLENFQAMSNCFELMLYSNDGNPFHKLNQNIHNMNKLFTMMGDYALGVRTFVQMAYLFISILHFFDTQAIQNFKLVDPSFICAVVVSWVMIYGCNLSILYGSGYFSAEVQEATRNPEALRAPTELR
jgi:hypothetical protein